MTLADTRTCTAAEAAVPPCLDETAWELQRRRPWGSVVNRKKVAVPPRPDETATKCCCTGGSADAQLCAGTLSLRADVCHRPTRWLTSTSTEAWTEKMSRACSLAGGLVTQKATLQPFAITMRATMLPRTCSPLTKAVRAPAMPIHVPLLSDARMLTNLPSSGPSPSDPLRSASARTRPLFKTYPSVQAKWRLERSNEALP
eukprot:CAMPEP_0172027658 /NCGR_PEP_ID=MMETSP1041-20130122/17120_1 /TAXON_ID=464988 /ORGANISM="Hemiselmis andersenii, Strain CCMP439" /LENGTH=200 /DNA_ID=CAMNT_0012683579 /DNA_START=52 /DNA_END=651 /DNA_ORIENTATION=-